MRIDAHVHVFPLSLRDRRRPDLQRDLTYRTLYASPDTPIASAGTLIESMDRNGIDRAVLANIGWTTLALCRETNDGILEAAREHPQRLIPFCSVNPMAGPAAVEEIERCAALGAKGLGELHPDTQEFDLGDARMMAPIMDAAQRHNMIVMTHASEPVGHLYPGKGQVTPQVLYRFVTNFPEARVILAHWGGGLPFYALMPEVRRNMANVWFDTAASPFLYEARVFEAVAGLAGADRILFGTDFPLIKHERLLQQVEQSGLTAEQKVQVPGENAARLLGS